MARNDSCSLELTRPAAHSMQSTFRLSIGRERGEEKHDKRKDCDPSVVFTFTDIFDEGTGDGFFFTDGQMEIYDQTQISYSLHS